MKKLEFRKLIKEEIQKILSEASLTDFGFDPGSTEIWYEKATNFDGWKFRKQMYAKEKDHDMGYTKRYGSPIDPKNLKKTHAFMGKIKETNLNKIYDMMQGENWGQGSVTNKFLKSKGVGHTSMSIGDIIKIGGKVMFVDTMGFTDISKEKSNEVNLREMRGYFAPDMLDHIFGKGFMKKIGFKDPMENRTMIRGFIKSKKWNHLIMISPDAQNIEITLINIKGAHVPYPPGTAETLKKTVKEKDAKRFIEKNI